MGGNRMNNHFWQQTLVNLSRYVGLAEPVVDTQIVCIDRNRQWRHVRNLRYSATVRSARRTMTAPLRKLTGKG